MRSRPLKPTSAGQLLLKHTRQMRLLRADLERDLQDLAPNSIHGARDEERISIAVNADSIATWALPALDGLARQGVPLEIVTDDQDFTHEWLRDGKVVGCVTTREAGPARLQGGAAGRHALCRRGAARVRREHHVPKGLGAHNFRAVPFVAFNRKDDLQGEFVAKAFGLKRVALNQLFVPSSEGQVRAVLAGWGVSVVPLLLARGLLEQGQLVNVAPSHTLPVQLYWHCWNLASEVLDALSAALTGRGRGRVVAAAEPARLVALAGQGFAQRLRLVRVVLALGPGQHPALAIEHQHRGVVACPRARRRG